MKTLYLLRHAKSSWGESALRDFERPVAPRGLNDVKEMGERFVAKKQNIECIVSSPAVRAKTTAIRFAEAIGFPHDEITANPELYFAGAAMFLKAARLVDDDFDSAMLVGHNPAITEFLNDMIDGDIANVPTCGLAELRLPIEHWADVDYGNAGLVAFDFPKKDPDADD